MTSTRSETLGARGGIAARSSKNARGWVWFVLVAVAILGLLAWNGPDRLETRAAEQSAAAETQPAFDGRGKWGGYAR